ncbi:MAG: PAS domain S-box protein [Chlorobiaceae bacterium]|nr:PAS domain S-box protein [Chlorobiaceae bacterium]
MQNREKQPMDLYSTDEGSWELVSERFSLRDYCCALTGRTPDETVFDARFLKSVIHPDDHQLFFTAVHQLTREKNESSTIIFRLVHKDGSVRWVECIMRAAAFDDKGSATKISGHIIDVTEFKKTETQFHKLNRSLLAINNCNRALLRASNEMELLNDICRTIVEIGGYRMAWVGYAQDDTKRSVTPVAHAGIEEGYLETLNVTWSDTERGRGPVGTAIRSGKICSTGNLLDDPQFKPWKSEAKKRGYASVLSLPLINDHGVFGALSIYSAIREAFDTDETMLLTSFADNLAYGISMLQNRKAKELAEEAMRQSEARYRSLFQNKYIVMLIIDPENGAIVDANPAAVEFYGWQREKLCKMNIAQINQLPQEELQLKMLRANKGPCNNFVFPHRLANGSIREVEVVSGPITVEGKPLLYTIVNDITERNQFQEMLVEGNRRMHYIMNSTNAGLWENGTGSNTTTVWSDELWPLYGLEPQSCEPSFENWLKTIIPEDRETVRNQAEKALQNSTEFNSIWRVRDQNGAIRWLMSKGSPFTDPDGKVLRYVGIVIDITDRKKEEEAKHQLEAQLRKAQRLESIGTLAGGIAHDFNNILTPILGYSELGLFSLQPEEPMHEYFNEIMRAATRAQNLIEQILTFSRTQEVTPSVVSVQAVISEAMKLLRPSIPSTITIEQDIDESCKNILADPSQIHQVIVNLCTNAFQAMEDTVGHLRIGLREIVVDKHLRKTLPALHEDNYVQLSISDTGTGMDEATMERIFEPFFTTKAMNKGTGLGLSVVHGIVTGYKGVISVDSRPGKGTSFNIYLPVIDQEIVHTKTSCPLLQLNNSSILFVDDEESSTRMMTIMLAKFGLRLQTTNSPIEAVALLRQNPKKFDLVITDLTMPEMNGIDLARELHRISPRIPIILMTGYEKDLGNADALHASGISTILKKPAKMAQLVSTINDVISCAAR